MYRSIRPASCSLKAAISVIRASPLFQRALCSTPLGCKSKGTPAAVPLRSKTIRIQVLPERITDIIVPVRYVSAFVCTAALFSAFTVPLLAQEPPAGRGRGGRGGGGLLAQAGAADKQVVDPAAADRGKKIYIAECITCHGSTARGAQNGPDLVRSLVVLHDRYGDTLGPFLKKGHPTQSTPSANLTKEQVLDVSHFLHLKVEDTLRTSPLFHVQNILTGDPKAGEAYFNGAGRCNTCHSVTGDLKGYASKYDPVDIQQRFLFPRPGFGRNVKRVTATVTAGKAAPVTGVLDHIDDFSVSVREADGTYRSFMRGPAVTVKIDDPYLRHAQLLDEYTDKDIHNITAYLETLK
ncbi:MAG: cytochrome c [Acidobacteriota bacterium]|nr:cytochrome c [Acidobacteriota bacterium]